MNRSLLAGALLMASLLTPVYAFAKDSVPQWVKDAAAEKLPAYPAETDAVVLLREDTTVVQGPGKATEHLRLVIRILRPQGREYADLSAEFDDESKINSMHIWTLAADGHEYQLPDSQLTNEGDSSGGNMLELSQYRHGKAPAADVGAVIALEYDRRERPYMTEDFWSFQREIPVHRAVYSLELPLAFEYRANWVRRDPVEPTNIGPNKWQWMLTDVPAVDLRHVALHPARGAVAQRMSVQYFGPGITAPFRGDWVSVGQWYTGLADGRFTPTPEITAKAQEVTAGKTDFYSKGEAIARFMQQNIRYYAVEIGVGGNQPHPAADVFHNKYGDCKDKATLLISMLGVAGINAHLVMVDDRRGVVDPKSPSIVGNHMIAAVEVPNGTDMTHLQSVVKLSTGKRYLIFDPTQEYVPFGQIPFYEQGSYGLLIDGAHSAILPLPVQSPENSTILRTAKFSLHSDGSLTGDVTEKSFGDAALIPRAQLSNSDEKQRDRWLDRVVKQDLTSFTVADMKLDHLKELDKDLELHYSVTAPSYSRNAGGLVLLRPRVLGQDSPDVDHEAKRTMAIDLERAGMEHDDFTIALPEGYTVDELPDPVKLDLGFASYESSTSLQANTLHYTRTYTLREVQLPAEKYVDLMKLAGVIQADEQSRAVLKRAVQ